MADEFVADLVERGPRRTAADFADTGYGAYIADVPAAPASVKTGITGKDIGLAGIFLGGLGSLFRAGAEQARGRAARTAADLSAEFSERAAADAVQRGLMREYEITARGDSVIAQQRAQSSTGALDVNVGAPQATEQASQANLDFDRALVRRNAALDAYGLRARAQQQRQEGEYAEEEGSNAATGTFLSGLANVALGVGKFAVDNPEVLAGV